MSDKWTDKLPSLMEGYEEAAPEGLWDAVSSSGAPKRRRAVAWWTGGVLAAAAAVALFVFLWRPDRTERSVVPEATLAEAVTVVEEAREVVPEVMPVEASETVPESAAKAIRQVQKTVRQKASAVETVAAAGPVETAEPTETVGTAPETTAQVQNRPETHPEEAREPDPSAKPAQNAPGFEQSSTPKADSQRQRNSRRNADAPRIQVTLGTGGFLANASGGTTRGYGIPYNPGMPMTTLTKADSEPITVPMLGRNRESTTQSSHRQSVKLNIGISYSFAPRWSVGSGVTYTVLRSEYTTDSGNTVSKATRQLHYLGIPLNLQFMVFEWRELGIGVNAGGMWETAVGSRLNKMEYVGDELASESQEFPGVKDQRWSINGGVSLQYQLFRYGAIFVQPGVSWHIPGNNEVESYYTVHPVAFDFTLGYRFTF